MNDDKLQMTILFDFFGELLTGKQREYYDLYYNEDLSLSEIAERAGITRQGVCDIVNRAAKALTVMEKKTGVVNRWRETRLEVERAERKALELLRLTGGEGQTADIARELVDILSKLNTDNW